MVSGAELTLPGAVVIVMVMVTVTPRVPAHLTVKAILMDAVVGMIVVEVMATVAVMATGNPIAQVWVMNINGSIYGNGCGSSSGEGYETCNGIAYGSCNFIIDHHGRGHGSDDCDGYGVGLCHGSLLSPLECYVSDFDIRDNRGHGFADGYGTNDCRGKG